MDANTTITSNNTVITSTTTTNDTDDDSDAPWLSPRYKSTKFILALLFSVTGCAALMMHIFDPASFNWLVAIVLTGHGASNILDKKFNGGQQP